MRGKLPNWRTANVAQIINRLLNSRPRGREDRFRSIQDVGHSPDRDIRSTSNIDQLRANLLRSTARGAVAAEGVCQIVAVARLRMGTSDVIQQKPTLPVR